jgi:predicted DNA-binding transcriptional regulator AlpA
MQIESTPARLLRTVEAAQFLGLAPSTLEKLRCIGGGPTFTKLGARAVGYFPDDLLTWARAQRRASTSDSDAAK